MNLTAYSDLPPELRANRLVAKHAFQKYGGMLQYAPDHFRDDEELVRIAIRSNPDPAFKYASERLRGDCKFVEEVVLRDGLMLKYASEQLRKNEYLVICAVGQNPWAYLNVLDEFKNFRPVAFLAVAKEPRIYPYCPDSIASIPEIARFALRDPDAAAYIPTNLRNKLLEEENER